MRAGAQSAVLDPGLFFRLVTVVTLTSGTVFLMWLGEQITERGLGNGISLIIFAGIAAGLPRAIGQTLEQGRTGAYSWLLIIGIAALVVVVTGFVVFMERALRKILVNYAKRQVGNRVYQGQSSHLPLKINVAGVIPPIFASSILMFPAQIAGFVQSSWMQKVSDVLTPADWRYNVLYIGLIVFFCYFYTAVTFNPVDVADNMKKYGGFVPGIRPGRATAEYIDKVLTRLTFGGAIYISAVCVLPTFMTEKFKVPFYFGGTSILIVVSVTMDTVTQIQSHLLAHQYEGLIRKARVRHR